MLHLTLQAWGYVGGRAQSVDGWIDDGTRFLGMQIAGCSRSTAAFRMDERQQRLSVREGDDAASVFYGSRCRSCRDITTSWWMKASPGGQRAGAR